MASREEIRQLIDELGEPYSEVLGIDLRKGGDPAYFEWLLAAFLSAKPIREESAMKTYRVFVENGLASPSAIEKAGWHKLVELCGKGGYTRYDESTSTRLLSICGNLLRKYGGKLSRLHEAAKDSEDLEQRIKDLGKGIGPVTISVFLRDIRSAWPKADPEPTPRVNEAARALGIGDVKEYARENGIDLVRLETALHRYSRILRRRERRHQEAAGPAHA
jgi:hypothetical protein